MVRLAVLVVLVVLSFGCSATPTTMMMNPRTGDVQQCRTMGLGAEGVKIAKESHDKCVEQLRELGYKPSGELTPEEKAGTKQQ